MKWKPEKGLVVWWITAGIWVVTFFLMAMAIAEVWRGLGVFVGVHLASAAWAGIFLHHVLSKGES